ncbi:MAG: hypothetical protein KR126chlam2_00136 [Chlamydiae bacterium]|nr:hypothetical protein [Chlamydiota bacterium]
MTSISSSIPSQNAQALDLAGLPQSKPLTIWEDSFGTNDLSRPIFSPDLMEKIFILVAETFPGRIAHNTLANIRATCRIWKGFVTRVITPAIFRKAEMKDPSAMNLVGLTLISKWIDRPKALEYFTEAAKMGCKEAEANQQRVFQQNRAALSWLDQNSWGSAGVENLSPTNGTLYTFGLL